LGLVFSVAIIGGGSALSCNVDETSAVYEGDQVFLELLAIFISELVKSNLF
jgi:hypothetical protein